MPQELIENNGRPAPQLRPVRRARVSDEVVVQLAEAVISGAFAPGDKLPAERELAQRLEVNRTGLREALRRMESMGLVLIRPGDGVFVQPSSHSWGLELVKFLLAEGIGLDSALMLDLAQVRRIFALALIDLAAERIDEATLEGLQQLVDRYPRQDTAQRLHGGLDFEFFHLLAQGTGNRVLLYMLNTVREVFERVSVLYYQIEEGPEVTADVYGRLVKALREGNAKRAKKIFEQRMLLDDQTLRRVLERKP